MKSKDTNEQNDRTHGASPQLECESIPCAVVSIARLLQTAIVQSAIHKYIQ
jgi:hypothetical protein